MAIQGFQQYGGFYNRYQTNDIPSVSVQTVKQQEDQKKISDNSENVQSLQTNYIATNNGKEDTRSKVANLENISLTFQKNDNFDYIGSDSELDSLDVQKAVSDMKKDQVLEEYQYFVGGSQMMGAMQDNSDGLVFQKFDF